MTRTVFMARCNGEYFTETCSYGLIDKAMIFLTKEHAEFELEPRVSFEIIEFKLVEVKPTVRIILTSKGTDGVWTRVFQNYDLTNPLRREALSELLLQDIKGAQANRDRVRSGELSRLRAILRHALLRIETHDIVLGGVLLGRLECEVIG